MGSSASMGDDHGSIMAKDNALAGVLAVANVGVLADANVVSVLESESKGSAGGGGGGGCLCSTCCDCWACTCCTKGGGGGCGGVGVGAEAGMLAEVGGGCCLTRVVVRFARGRTARCTSASSCATRASSSRTRRLCISTLSATSRRWLLRFSRERRAESRFCRLRISARAGGATVAVVEVPIVGAALWVGLCAGGFGVARGRVVVRRTNLVTRRITVEVRNLTVSYTAAIIPYVKCSKIVNCAVCFVSFYLCTLRSTL